jgi:hypothetical protein
VARPKGATSRQKRKLYSSFGLWRLLSLKLFPATLVFHSVFKG